MDFQQPTTIATDPQVEAQITALRVQIADKEVEINTLDSVIRSNKYAIEQLTMQKLEIEGKLPELRTQKDQIEKEILQVVKQHEKALKNLDNVTVEAKNLKSDLDTRKAVIEKTEKEIADQKSVITLEKGELEFAQKNYVEDKKALDEKIEALKNIIN